MFEVYFVVKRSGNVLENTQRAAAYAYTYALHLNFAICFFILSDAVRLARRATLDGLRMRVIVVAQGSLVQLKIAARSSLLFAVSFFFFFRWDL